MSATYSLAIDFRSGEVSHAVERDRLVVRHAKSDRTESVPLTSIREINLRQEMAGIYSAYVTRDGGGTIRIPSRHFRGLGQFDDRIGEYAAFMRELLTAVAAAGARVTAGSSALYVLGWIAVAMGVIAVAMVAVGSYLHGSLPPLRGLFVLPIAFFVGFGLVRQGGRRAIDPASPPREVFPA